MVNGDHSVLLSSKVGPAGHATSSQQIWECLTTEVHGAKPISWLIVSIAAGVARVKYFLYVNVHTFILSPYY